MKTIEMGLQSKPFNQIKNGSKTIELRLFDTKRKDIKIGDRIEVFERIEDYYANTKSFIVSPKLDNEKIRNYIHGVNLDEGSKPEDAINHFRQILEDTEKSDKYIRRSVVSVLSQIESKEVIKLLGRACSDADDNVRTETHKLG